MAKINTYNLAQKSIDDICREVNRSLDEALFFMAAGLRRLRSGKVLIIKSYVGRGRPKKCDYYDEKTWQP